MKTVFFIISICFFFYGACAQTVFEEGNLQDVFLKAKKEGKMVMIVGSATWCAPCQALKKNVFPTKEAGNYFNANFVLKRYELDKADPDQVVERYKITAYPTTVILNADGHELARILGGAEDAKGFIEKIKKAVSPDNLLDAKKKQFEKDPSYGIRYVRFLHDSCYKYEEADEALKMLLNRRSIEENFNAESMAYYKSQSINVKSVVISYMLENPQKIISIIGEKEYRDLLALKVNEYIMRQIFPRSFDANKFQEAISWAMQKKDLQTGFVLFMNAVKNSWIAREYDKILGYAKGCVKKVNSKNRNDIVTAVRILCGRDDEILDSNVYALISLLDVCLQYENDIECKKIYENHKIDMENVLRIRGLK